MIKYILFTALYVFVTNCVLGNNGVFEKVLVSDYGDGYIYLFNKSNAEEQKIIHELDSLYEKTSNIAYLSDKAYVHREIGAYEAALETYFKIEELEPQQYTNAIGIVKTYELSHENEKALEWFNKSRAIRPINGDKFEEIRAKVLEAKLGGASFIENLTSTFFTGVDFGNDARLTCDLEMGELSELIEALEEHVREEATYREEEKKILAFLLFELGNALAYQNQDVSAAELFREYEYEHSETAIFTRSRCGGPKPLYEYYEDNNYVELNRYSKAKKYGFNNPVFEKRMAHIQALNMSKSEALRRAIQNKELGIGVGTKLGLSGVFLSIGFLVIVGIFFLIKRKNNE